MVSKSISAGNLRFYKRDKSEAALDGIYVIRTSVGEDQMSDTGAVEAYKGLSVVERDFRNLKAIDLDLRPIYHWSEQRVRAHVFLCMLSAYVTWHLRRAWAPLCFSDDEIPKRDDPVGKALRSEKAKRKDATKTTEDGEVVHNFQTLLDHLATITRNRVAFAKGVTIEKLSLPTPTQRRAFELIGTPIPKLGLTRTLAVNMLVSNLYNWDSHQLPKLRMRANRQLPRRLRDRWRRLRDFHRFDGFDFQNY
jgi:hypothetical protein